MPNIQERVYILLQKVKICTKYHTFTHNCNSIAVIYVKLISYSSTAAPKDFRRVTISRLKASLSFHTTKKKVFAAALLNSSST